MLTRKLIYSIYYFLFSSVEFILKKKVPEIGGKKRLICIKILLQIHCFGEEKRDVCSQKMHKS